MIQSHHAKKKWAGTKTSTLGPAIIHVVHPTWAFSALTSQNASWDSGLQPAPLLLSLWPSKEAHNFPHIFLSFGHKSLNVSESHIKPTSSQFCDLCRSVQTFSGNSCFTHSPKIHIKVNSRLQILLMRPFNESEGCVCPVTGCYLDQVAFIWHELETGPSKTRAGKVMHESYIVKMDNCGSGAKQSPQTEKSVVQSLLLGQIPKPKLSLVLCHQCADGSRD